MKLFALVILVSIMLVNSAAQAADVAWGRGQDGATYCFPADKGKVIPGGSPVDDRHCGVTYKFARSSNGGNDCFPAKLSGETLKGRYAESNVHLCAHGYKWSRSTTGEVLCFPTDSSGKVPAGISAVGKNYCL